MNKLFNYVIRLGCSFIYFFMKFKKTKQNKVVFISRLDNKKTLDFQLLEDYLKKNNPELECIFITKRVESFTKDLIGNIKYTLKCLSEIASAKVAVTDSFSIAISSVNHKKDLKVIQIWHSLGAIKKFGYQTLGNVSGRDTDTAKVLRMHANYDYVISGSQAMSELFAVAFNTPLERFKNYCLPRIDYLVHNKEKLQKEIYKEYPELKKKPIVLYAPTFRTTGDDKTVDLINAIDTKKFNLIVKGHANQKLDTKNMVHSVDKFTALQCLAVADYLITDYSGIAIEGSTLDVKTLYYVYDYDKYQANNGINIDLYKEMPGCVFQDEIELADKLNRNDYDINVLLNYKNKYLTVQDGTATEKICDLIKECTKN